MNDQGPNIFAPIIGWHSRREVAAVALISDPGRDYDKPIPTTLTVITAGLRIYLPRSTTLRYFSACTVEGRISIHHCPSAF